MNGILIVEDEPNLGTTLNEYLGSLGHHCALATTATKARDLFSKQSPAIVLMDIGLPDGNGLDLAREFREQRKDFVLLFLSALNDPDIRVEGLEIGAADYITKPFALKELTLRLERILATSEMPLPNIIKAGPLEIHFSSYELIDAHGETIPLAQKECAILKLLFLKQGEAVTREDILNQVWGSDKFPSERTVDNYIVKLRKWCESDSTQSITIHNIRGVGYKMTVTSGE
ncbi:MAG: DNA-binding response regulator [Halobacteriovorax sp.]|nr:DNA-binding response regulator [Halobacteriovorax sp.]